MKASSFILTIVGIYSNNLIQCHGIKHGNEAADNVYVDIESILGDLLTRPTPAFSPKRNHVNEFQANNSTGQRRDLCDDPSCGGKPQEIITKHFHKSFQLYTDEPISRGTLQNEDADGEGVERANLFSNSGNPIGYVHTVCQETVKTGEQPLPGSLEYREYSLCYIALRFLNQAKYDIGSLYLQGYVYTGGATDFTDVLAVNGGSGCFAGAVGTAFREFSAGQYDIRWKFTLYEYWKHEYYWLLQ